MVTKEQLFCNSPPPHLPLTVRSGVLPDLQGSSGFYAGLLLGISRVP